MQNVLRNRILFLFAALAIACSAIFLIPRADAQPSSISVQTTAAATTTVAYEGPGLATSTYQIDSYPTYSSSKVFSMAGIDAEYLFIQTVASSSATIFWVTPQFSNNGIDWYNYGQALSSGSFQTTLSSTTVYAYGPLTTATSGVAFKLPDMSALHERVLLSAVGANGSIYGEVVLKKNPSGQ